MCIYHFGGYQPRQFWAGYNGASIFMGMSMSAEGSGFCAGMDGLDESRQGFEGRPSFILDGRFGRMDGRGQGFDSLFKKGEISPLLFNFF